MKNTNEKIINIKFTKGVSADNLNKTFEIELDNNYIKHSSGV